MRNEFSAIIEQDGPWYVAYCAEVPGANGHGKTREECLTNLREAIALMLEYRREESLRSLPADAAAGDRVYDGRGYVPTYSDSPEMQSRAFARQRPNAGMSDPRQAG
jgi:predicted RNase H-like HicB family nuclease